MSGTISLLYVYMVIAVVCQCAIWEFGVDRKNSLLIMHNRGQMSRSQTIKNIAVKIPKCHKIIYVRVEVINAATTPQVTFNKGAKRITIDYIKSPNTESSFEIVGKGVKDKHCADSEPDTTYTETTTFKTTTMSSNGVGDGKPLPASYRVSYT